jgi:hypothetical protein
MKTLAAADKEARKAATGGELTISEQGQRFFSVGDYDIEYFGNGGKEPTTAATNFYVRKKGREDDIQSDYWAGHWEKTITAAIRYARRASAPSATAV